MGQTSLILHLWIAVIYHMQYCFGFIDLSLIKEPSDAAVPLNSTLLLKCQAGGREPISYLWKHNGQVLGLSQGEGTGYKLANGSLTIHSVRSDTTGTYRCCASNYVGTLCSREATVSVAWVGIPQVVPGDVQIEDGGAIRLMCQVDSSPTRPEVRWHKDGVPLVVTQPRIVQLPGAVLHITSAVQSDSGQYSCTAQNAFRSRNSTGATMVTVVEQSSLGNNDQQGWGIRQGPQDTRVTAQSDVVLECLLNREENTDVTWKRKDGKQLSSEKHEIYGRRNLRIRNVTVNDNSTYVCHARNTVTSEEDSAFAILTVTSPPVFRKPMVDVQKNYRSSSRLHCNVTGDPPPKVTWYKDGELAIERERVTQRVPTQLYIWATVPEDSGIYQCFAYNSAGSVWGALYYNVLLPVSNVTAHVYNNHSILITWQPVYQPNIQAYSIYYNPSSKDRWDAKVASRNMSQYLFTNLRPFTNYTFSVTAFTTKGASQPTPYVYAHTPEAKPKSAPQFWLTSRSPYSIDIHWLPIPKEDRNGVIDRYKICHQEVDVVGYSCFEKSADVNHLLLSSLKTATSYRINMAAATSQGFGPESEWATIKTMDIGNCTVPGTLLVSHSVLNATAVEINWSLLATTGGTTTTTTSATYTTEITSPEVEAPEHVTGFKLTLTSLNKRSQHLLIFRRDIRSVTIGTLEPGTSYDLQMQVLSVCGEGQITVVRFQIPLPPISEDLILLPPYDLRTYAVSSTAINLQWHPPHTSFTVLSYVVSVEPTRQLVGGPKELDSTTCSILLEDLEVNTEYKIRVKAKGIELSSQYSPPIYQNTMEDIPSAPTDVTLLPIHQDDLSVMVEWQPPDTPNGVITAYQVFYYFQNTSKYANRYSILTNGTTLQAAVHNILVGKSYLFSVQAFTSVGGGPLSDPVPFLIKQEATVQDHGDSSGDDVTRGIVTGELEKGIVVGIVLATLCIMICTLLLLVRHRRHCQFQVCAKKREEGNVNEAQVAGRPCQEQTVLNMQDMHSREPLLNGHAHVPLDRYLNVSVSPTNPMLPPRVDSALPHQYDYHQNSPPQYQQTVDTPDIIDESRLENTTQDIQVHPLPLATSVPDDQIQFVQHRQPSESDSPPRPASFRGTSSDSGMDGDIEWDMQELSEDFTETGAEGGSNIDPQIYLCNKGVDGDTSVDFVGRALYLCNDNITQA